MGRTMQTRGNLFRLPIATDIADVIRLDDLRDEDWDEFGPVARAANDAMLGVFVEDLNTTGALSAS